MLSLAIVALCFLSGIENAHSEPSYQVLLLNENSRGGFEDGECLGNIIQGHVVLTAASCVWPNAEEPIRPEKLAVSFKVNDVQELTYFVKTIEIYPKFNVSTWDHDIALLSLSTQLPLSEREDMDWILLADFELTTEGPVDDAVESFISKDSVLPDVYSGYGVVYDSSLVGIVSQENPDDKDDQDFGFTPKNRFISISPYLSWIYGILEKAELTDLKNNNYSVSLPYREKKTADMVAVQENIENEKGYFRNSAKGINTPSIGHWILIFYFITTILLSYY